MRLDFKLLRTRVARRMLGLFLISAVLPIVTFALVSYRLMGNRLEADASEQLRQQSKATGQVVLERIRTLSRELAFSLGKTALIDPGSAPVPGDTATQRASRFAAVMLTDGTDTPAELRGIPPLGSRQLKHLAMGSTVLVTARLDSVNRVILIAPVVMKNAASGYAWGVLDPALLLGEPEDMAADLSGPAPCLVDATGVALECDDPETAQAMGRFGSISSTTRVWRGTGEAMLTGYWQLFLNYDFAAAPLTLALTRPVSEVLAPLADYRRNFFLGVVLAVMLVFVLSHAQIRRSMTPLADLEDGTKRVRSGDFSSRVVVNSKDEFESLAQSFNQMAGDLQQQFATLHMMHAIDRAALSDRSAHAIAAAALSPVAGLLSAGHVALYMAMPETANSWQCFVPSGDSVRRLSELVDFSDDELSELAICGDALHLEIGATRSYLTAGSTGKSVNFPIISGNKLIGLLVVISDGSRDLEPRQLQVGRQVTDQLAVGLSNVTLLAELDALSLGALTALARTIDAASPWTGGHSERVTQGALEIGARMGIAEADLLRLQQGGLLHDIGKIGIPSAILDKPGRLTDEEMLVMQSHPVVGAEIIGSIRAFHDLVPLVKHHHELLDGSGYPSRLAGEQIPDLVRILTVADVYDALVSDRPYRAGLGSVGALRIIEEGAGKKFDERAVAALRAMVADNWEPTLNAVAVAHSVNRELVGAAE
jgi:putative nucleotidyltransferase with HDIG domain